VNPEPTLSLQRVAVFRQNTANLAVTDGRRSARTPRSGELRRTRLRPQIAAGLGLLLVAFVGYAGPEHLIKQRAKDVANQNNQRQGVPSPPPPSAPPAQPVTAPAPVRPAGPALSTQAAAIRDALAAVLKAGDPTDDTTQALQQSLSAAASAKARPSETTLAKLARDLAKGLSGTDLSSAAQSQLALQLETLLKSPATAKDTETRTTAIHDLLREVGVGRVDAMVVANDLKVVGLELQQAAAK
jgi:hypothetical protein